MDNVTIFMCERRVIYITKKLSKHMYVHMYTIAYIIAYHAVPSSSMLPVKERKIYMWEYGTDI